MKVTDRAIYIFLYLRGRARNVDCAFAIMCMQYFDHMYEKKNRQQ